MDWRRTWLPYMQHWGTGNSVAFCWPQFQNWSIVGDALFENHKNSNGQNETGSFQYFSAEKHAALGVGENLVFLSFIKTESFLSGNLACAFSYLLVSILTIYRSFCPTRIALFHTSSEFVLFSLSCSVVLFLAKHEIALDQKWNISTLQFPRSKGLVNCIEFLCWRRPPGHLIRFDMIPDISNFRGKLREIRVN